jgi:hypothetical protein
MNFEADCWRRPWRSISTIAFYLGFVSLIILTNTLNAQTSNEYNQENYETITFNYQEADTIMQHGVYGELDIKIEGNDFNYPVEVSFADDMIPMGMNVYAVSNELISLAGTPQFLGEFCFVMSVKIQDTEGQKDIRKRLCVIGEASEMIPTPSLKEEKFLPSQTTNQSINLAITQDSTNKSASSFRNGDVEFFTGSLPEGVNVYSRNGSMSLSGSAKTEGIYEFVVSLQATNISTRDDVIVYKQYQIEISNEQEKTYQCAPGYYYDDRNGHCVQAGGSQQCDFGQLYDAETNTCLNKPALNYGYCPAGLTYDYWSNRCIRRSARYCPYNYRWSNYHVRCVRLPYTCRIGYKYSWTFGQCLYVGYRICLPGEYYDAWRGRCRSIWNRGRGCGLYSYYSWSSLRCQPYARRCEPSFYWNTTVWNCRSINTWRRCRPGSYYDWGRLDCFRRRVYSRRASCRVGFRWSNHYGYCTSVRVVRTRRRVITPRRVGYRNVVRGPRVGRAVTHRAHRPVVVRRRAGAVRRTETRPQMRPTRVGTQTRQRTDNVNNRRDRVDQNRRRQQTTTNDRTRRQQTTTNDRTRRQQTTTNDRTRRQQTTTNDRTRRQQTTTTNDQTRRQQTTTTNDRTRRQQTTNNNNRTRRQQSTSNSSSSRRQQSTSNNSSSRRQQSTSNNNSSRRQQSTSNNSSSRRRQSTSKPAAKPSPRVSKPSGRSDRSSSSGARKPARRRGRN